jgi:hypothetical protein
MGQAGVVDRWRNMTLLIVVFLYLLLNWGFQQVRVPPVANGGLPIGEFVLFMSLATINYNRVLGRMGQVVPLLPFLIWWAFGLGRALFDFGVHGSWALRDAAHVIESLFLIAGFVFAGDRRSMERFFAWLPVVLTIGVLYGFLYPIRDQIWAISPTITTANGFQAPIFGTMVNTPFLLIPAAIYLILFQGRRLHANLIAVMLLGYTLAVFQARTLYLVLIAVFGFLALYRRSSIGNLGIVVYVSALLFALVTLIGVEVEGRLGAAFTPEFLYQHFLAIFGICDPSLPATCAAAEGVGQRLGWWEKIFSRLFVDPVTPIVGLGYGTPLTDFHGNSGTVAREPHNSYISLIARIGLIGGIAWFVMTAFLYRAWHLAYRRCQQLGWHLGQSRLLVLMVYFICMWVLALGEDGFEKPYNIIPYYFFWGIVLRFALDLKQGQIGPVQEYRATG